MICTLYLWQRGEGKIGFDNGTFSTEETPVPSPSLFSFQGDDDFQRRNCATHGAAMRADNS